MDIKEYARKRLEKSAEKAKRFWGEVKARLPKDPVKSGDSFTVLDVQEISDDCIDLIMVRSCDETNLDQLDHWRIVAEKRLFKKPKIKIIFTSGPFVKDFIDEDNEPKNT